MQKYHLKLHKFVRGVKLFISSPLASFSHCQHCLSSGSTPLGCYKKLIEFYKNGEVSFHYVKTFNMDEYVGKLESFHFQELHNQLIMECRKTLPRSPQRSH